MRLLSSLFLFFLSLSVFGQYKNVQIEAHNGMDYPPCEPSIGISRKDPSVMVAGAILDKVYLSTDGGESWAIDQLESKHGVFGDPCVVASPSGGFFYFHLSNPSGKGWADDSLLDRIVCQYSKDGKEWSEGAGIGLNHPKDQDKEWADTDEKGKTVYATWTEFDKYGSEAKTDSTYILFSRGDKKGEKWTRAVRINQHAGDCLDGDETTEGAVPAAGRGQKVFVAWALNDTIWFDRSYDRGDTWLEQDKVAAIIHGGWDQTIPGINRANGMPVTVVDRSGGDHDGRIYILWSDQRNGEDDTDIWVCYSDDEGDSWSESKRVNDDEPGKHQFFPWVAIDQTTGVLYAVFYDRRNFADWSTEVYLASSNDGGGTWVNEKISESPFVPSPTVFFGDYNNIDAHDGVVRPIWTRCDERRLSVWTALINKK